MSAKGTDRVVCFADRDHVLELAALTLRGPSLAADAAFARFLAPEDLPAAAPRHRLLPAGVTVVDPPESYGALARPPADTEVLVVRRSPVRAELMAGLPRLRHIQKLGDRLETVDAGWARDHGITIGVVPRPTLDSTADHAVMLMLALLRRLKSADAAVRSNTSGSSTPGSVSYNWTGVHDIRPLSACTVGLIGLGEVGLRVAQRVAAFGARVMYSSRTGLPGDRERELGLQGVDLPTLLAASDIVSLHVPATEANRHLLDDAGFGAMKSGALLVNVARGSLVDEAALLRALRSGRLGGAALDVHAREPRRPDDPLLDDARVLLTPHFAGGPRSGALREVQAVVDGVLGALTRQPSIAGAP
jgi:phosphoglycerate dehydrogenase-like enzyme